MSQRPSRGIDSVPTTNKCPLFDPWFNWHVQYWTRLRGNHNQPMASSVVWDWREGCICHHYMKISSTYQGNMQSEVSAAVVVEICYDWWESVTLSTPSLNLLAWFWSSTYHYPLHCICMSVSTTVIKKACIASSFLPKYCVWSQNIAHHRIT